MAISALAVPEPVSHHLHPASQALSLVTADALELGVSAFKRIVGQLLVGEGLNGERLRGVTGFTLALGRAEPELPSVNVPVATGAVARRPLVRRSSPAEPILLRRAMAAVTGGFRMSAGQRPSAVVDLR